MSELFEFPTDGPREIIQQLDRLNRLSFRDEVRMAVDDVTLRARICEWLRDEGRAPWSVVLDRDENGVYRLYRGHPIKREQLYQGQSIPEPAIFRRQCHTIIMQLLQGFPPDTYVMSGLTKVRDILAYQLGIPDDDVEIMQGAQYGLFYRGQARRGPTPLVLSGRLKARADAVSDLHDIEQLVSDISIELKISRIAIGWEQSPFRLWVYSIERGDPIERLSSELKDRIDQLNRDRIDEMIQLMGFSGNTGEVGDPAWDTLRKDVAQYAQLPLSYIERYINPVTDRWEFRRSYVPDAGEIAPGQVLVIPDQYRTWANNVLRNHLFGEEWDDLRQAIALTNRLPPGRVTVHAKNFVYQSSKPGELVSIPSSIAERIRNLKGSLDKQQIHEEVAKYNGYELGDIEMITTSEGTIEFRLREARERPRRPKRIGRRDMNVATISHKSNLKVLPSPDQTMGPGAIVGIVMGSMFLIVSIFFIVLYVRKRRVIKNS